MPRVAKSVMVSSSRIASHQEHLGARDTKRDHSAEGSEIYTGDRGGHAGGYQQRQQNLYVGSDGIDMSVVVGIAHDYFTRWRSIRYNSGNRKIQMMSTKCQ